MAAGTRTRLRSAGTSSIAQVALFSRASAPAPFQPGRVLLVGVDDTAVEHRPPPHALTRFGDDLGVRYLPEWELTAAGLTPSFWISLPAPSAYGRRVLFETIKNQMVEQDHVGRIWVDDALVCSGSLLAFGTPTRGRESDFVLGEDAALLLGRRGHDGWDLRIHLTSAVLWVFALPHCRPAPHLTDWMHLATPATADQVESCG